MAGVEVVDAADDSELAFLEAFHEVGGLGEALDGELDVALDGEGDLLFAVEVFGEVGQGGFNAVEERDDFVGLLGRLGGMVDGGLDGTALAVSEDEDQLDIEVIDPVFDAGGDVGVGDVAGDADDEEVAEALVEEEFRRHAGVGAAEDDGEGVLGGFEGGAPVAGFVGVLQLTGDEAAVAVFESLEGIEGSDGRGGLVVGGGRGGFVGDGEGTDEAEEGEGGGEPGGLGGEGMHGSWGVRGSVGQWGSGAVVRGAVGRSLSEGPADRR